MQSEEILLSVNKPALWLANGTIKFSDKVGSPCIASRPFIYVDEDIDLKRFYETMTNDWKEFKPANLVVSVINSISNHKPFKTFKINETLRDGIQRIINGSKVWFIGNGIDIGLPQLIGSVVQETIALRAEDVSSENEEPLSKKWNALTFLGIISDQSIKQISDCLTANRNPTTIEINIDKRNKYSLNSDHTHFIIVREKVSTTTFSNVIESNSVTAECNENLIDSVNSSANRFRDRFHQFLRESKNHSASMETITFPLVYIFVRGTLDTIEILQDKIEQNLPVVIINGTGSVADLIALAYNTINTKTNKIYDDVKLKKELNRCLLDEYPTLSDQMIKRHKIRDDIIYIAKENESTKLKLLSFIDVNSPILAANDIHKTILSAYLKSQKVVVENKINVEMQNTLLKLTLDWGLIDIAQSEIFDREDFRGYDIPDDLFKQALLGDDLETFVDLFLERDFSLHGYLKSNRLRDFFNRQKDRDFFTTTSLEGILGWSGDDKKVPKCFIEHAFIDIIRCLTNIKIDFPPEFRSDTISSSINEIPNHTLPRQQKSAETEFTQAIRYLVICAVLTNRHNLVKILWKRTSEPVLLALLCSMMLHRLTFYCREPYQKSLGKKQVKEYTDYAIGVLDKSFKENEIQTFQMLSKEHPDFNSMTVVQLAYNWNNKEFLSHAILQKWVTRHFYGEITPRGLSWGSLAVSEHLKITLSALFIFPMWFWINFSAIGQEELKDGESQNSEKSVSSTDESPRSNEKDCQLSNKKY
ncbi:unnamed protein product [Adineta ricciae]|uniref:TRPM SLOG domain-containing protein n=1 Tax=Adineta ricciae TaxID=249248 RepID=A0A815WW67_ADIRI|nr:unnamed protein product [Adineta ricciae]